MSATVKFGWREFERVARNLGGSFDQIPYAISQAMNDAAEITRKELIEKTWPSHIQARNKSFMRAALSTKGTRASKKKLRVAIYDQLGRASLKLHADGGTKRPRGKSIAIPSSHLAGKRRGTGVPKGLRPRAVPNSFVKGDSLFQRVGSKNKHLKLMYTLRTSAPIRADVPFESEFKRVMRREVSKTFGPRLRAAMSTKRRSR